MTKNPNDKSEPTVCILCGDKLHKLDKVREAICDVCGKDAKIDHRCESAHFICPECLSLSVNERIKQSCLEYKGFDPIELSVRIMNSPVINMHGPEHHLITPAALLTCVHNKTKCEGDLAKNLDVIEAKAFAETADHCEFKSGSCGAAQGAGVFVSHYLKDKREDSQIAELREEITAKSIKAIIDHAGPRCCKRDTYLTLQTAVDFLKEKLDIELDYSEAKCVFSLRNKSCGREECDFYNMSYSLV